MRKAGRLVTQLYDDSLRGSGIRVTQYALMRNIEKTTGGASIGELADALGMEQSTATRNVELLKKNGYVSFARQQGDKRKKILSLTDAGREKLSEAMPLWMKAQERMRGILGEAGMVGLIDTLRETVQLMEGEVEENGPIRR
jgi:DNA-binding MarR family transcriptional regulator